MFLQSEWDVLIIYLISFLHCYTSTTATTHTSSSSSFMTSLAYGNATVEVTRKKNLHFFPIVIIPGNTVVKSSLLSSQVSHHHHKKQKKRNNILFKFFPIE